MRITNTTRNIWRRLDVKTLAVRWAECPKGYRAFGVCDAVMHHTLGSETLRVWLGRWRYVPRHSPLRHYYTFRNSILLYRRPYAPGLWIFNDVIRLGFMFVFYTLRTAPRGRHALMMIKGILDGLKGRTGPLPTTGSSFK